MRCLTLQQPWASLIAIGAKRIETRSWGTMYRGDLAIHAAKSVPAWARELSVTERFRAAFRSRGMPEIATWGTRRLPLGAVVAVATLAACVHTDHFTREKIGQTIRTRLGPAGVLTDEEIAFGDFTPGRWAWVLVDVRRLREPIPARGARQLWEWEPPEGLKL